MEYHRKFNIDSLWVVGLPFTVQVQRLMLRDNISEEYAVQKINSQLATEYKKKLADLYIDNSNTIDELRVIINQNLQETLKEKMQFQ